ncbi:MAG: thioredoxin family protein [candidate division Zixibacteria bacterium]|nr:thioredoxin family protein [candidate division Zixibacteria bacterium]
MLGRLVILMRIRSCILLLTLLIFVAGLIVAADSKEKMPRDEGANSKQDEISWFAYDEGLVKAKDEDKHLFVNFTTKWCGYCRKMNKTTFADNEIIEMMDEDFIAVKVDGDSKDTLEIDGYKIIEKNLTRYEYRVRGYPIYWFLKPDGTKLGSLRGYQHKNVLKQALEFVSERKYDSTKADTRKEQKRSDH